MNFKEKYPDFAAVEEHVRAARLERAVYVATMLTAALSGTANGLRKLVKALGGQLSAEADRRAIEADVFLKRSVPKY